ncbi:hypothetical protein LCGC14_0920490 [marine sediment metagenome]|uniref:Uncharacterized protein n=1 Tax=marine sediment metagenome TaxID=412755 RepID=A0A0F9NVS4_9ZZZZ
MRNRVSDALFRPFEVLRVVVKYMLTRICLLRDKQFCKRCGIDQVVVWTVPDAMWARVGKRYVDRCLCLECYARVVGDMTGLDVMGAVQY